MEWITRAADKAGALGSVPPRQLHEFVFSDDRRYLFGKRPTSEPQATARE